MRFFILLLFIQIFSYSYGKDISILLDSNIETMDKKKYSDLEIKQMTSEMENIKKETSAPISLIRFAYSHSCTPWQETGMLNTINRVIGRKPITVITTNKYSFRSNKIIIGNEVINRVGIDIYESKDRRVKFKFKDGEEYLLSELDNFKIITQKKTTWYNCILDYIYIDYNNKPYKVRF